MRQQIQNMMARASKLKGSITETYRDLVVNPSIPKEAFRFQVPEGLQPSPSPF
ncbi:MAG: hypothetical protein O2960_09205 [Verrucomicrobia bacterium]|nr:hypothetical protein [Verrucomicrobiota bacterium]